MPKMEGDKEFTQNLVQKLLGKQSLGIKLDDTGINLAQNIIRFGGGWN
jgi:hypothetical protein